jgi:hypothetical protein
MRKDPIAMPTLSPPHPLPTSSDPAATPRRWPLERILFLMAGTMTGLSAVLAALVSPWFLLLTGFVALNQLALVAFGNCPSSWVLRHRFGVKGAGER